MRPFNSKCRYPKSKDRLQKTNWTRYTMKLNDDVTNINIIHSAEDVEEEIRTFNSEILRALEQCKQTREVTLVIT